MHKKIRKHVVDGSNKATDFFLNSLPKMVGKQIHTISIGRVIKYEKSKHTCSIQLLPLDYEDGSKLPPITEVIVPASIWQTDNAMAKIKDKISIEYKSLKVGSVCTVGFFDTEIDNFSGKNNFKVETERNHAYTDAVVLGVIEP